MLSDFTFLFDFVDFLDFLDFFDALLLNLLDFADETNLLLLNDSADSSQFLFWTFLTLALRLLVSFDFKLLDSLVSFESWPPRNSYSTFRLLQLLTFSVSSSFGL